MLNFFKTNSLLTLGWLCLCQLQAAQNPNANATACQAGRQTEPEASMLVPRDFRKESATEKARRMQWFEQARFGIFIHWGLYSVPAGSYEGKSPYTCSEWLMEKAAIPAEEYRKYAARFNPQKFDAEAWAKSIAGSGAKYIVITTKHHEGFSMWDSAVSNYTITKATPFKRDVLAELSAACRKQGLKFGTYYSLLEWDNPTLGHLPQDNKQAYLRYLYAQLGELVNNYHSDLLWFDGEWQGWWTQQDGEQCYNYLRGLKPSLIVNNRVVKERSGIFGLSSDKSFGSDYGTPEQEIPARGFAGSYWESCVTMNQSWGYHADDKHYKSTRSLLEHLCDICSKGGNLLLNIAPDSQGLIPQENLQRLEQIGAWMKINSAAIHASKASPFERLDWGRATCTPQGIYLIVFGDKRQLSLPYQAAADTRITALQDGKQLDFKQDAYSLSFDAGQASQQQLPRVYLLSGSGKVLDGQLAKADGSFVLQAEDAHLPATQARYALSGGQYDTLTSGNHKQSHIENITTPSGQIAFKALCRSKARYRVQLFLRVENSAQLPQGSRLPELELKLDGKVQASIPLQALKSTQQTAGLRAASDMTGKSDALQFETSVCDSIELQAGLNQLQLALSKPLEAPLSLSIQKVILQPLEQAAATKP